MRTDSSPGTLPAREHLPATDAGTPVLDVVIPVYNEEKDLQPCVLRLHEHLKRTFPYAFRITIADNASTDTTPVVSARLAAELPEVRAFRLEQKGRGRALRTVWSASEVPVLAYMDVDLSTDLNALLPLVAPLISGHSDLAIGSRLARSSRVVRGPKREFISRAYNLILRGSLQARFSDAQCGFKAIRRDVAQVLLPLVEDTGWFFDTEMLVLAERAGLRIHEVPVDWVDDPNSTVHIVKTATDDLKGVWRVGKALATGSLSLDRLTRPFGDDPRDREIQDVPKGLARQLVGFCVVGGLSTLFYLRALRSLLSAAVVGERPRWPTRSRCGYVPTTALALRRPGRLVGGLVAALGMIFVARLGRQLALAAVGLGIVASLAGPTAYTLSTLQEGHTGSIVTAGPAGASMMGGPGGGRGGFGGGMPGRQNGNGTTPGQNQQGNGFPGGGAGGFGGGMPGQNGNSQNQQNGNGNSQGNGTPQGNGTTQGQGQNQQGGPAMGDGGRMGGGGGAGGLLNGASVTSEAKKLLEADSDTYTWAAAAIGAQNAASYQLATGDAVMAIGGFNGTDPSPTLAQFKKYVADGRIHYFISSGTGGGMGGSSDGTSSQITTWVEAHFKKVTVGSATFYDLTQKA
ncbi:hypothetical protein SALBM311S_13049 [Streptomyces alboniger]